MLKSWFVILLFPMIAINSISWADDPPNLIGCPSFDCAGDCSGYLCIGTGVPDSYSDGWCGDISHIGSGSGDVSPHSGSVMLCFDGTTPTGCSEFYAGCNVYHVLDIHDYRSVIDNGTARVDAKMYVNRVAGDMGTDTQFDLIVYACAGDVSQFPSIMDICPRFVSVLYSFYDPGTWELVTLSFQAPTDTDYIVISLVAIEDVYNDSSCPEFDGHYCDDVSLQIYDITPPAEPEGLSVAYRMTGSILTWNDALEDNFDHYRVYRGQVPDFTPTTDDLVSEPVEAGYVDTPTDNPWEWCYKVSMVTNAGVESSASAPEVITSVRQGGLDISGSKLAATPNPFNPQTTIRYDLPAPATVRLCIYSVSGSLVKILVDEDSQSQGSHAKIWAGRDTRGLAVPSGTYFYRLTAGGYSETRRMVLVR